MDQFFPYQPIYVDGAVISKYLDRENFALFSPLAKRLFTKPPRVIFRKRSNLENLQVKPKFSEKQIKITNLFQPKCSDKRCATCKIHQNS